jgi:hypothetical protein
MQSFRALIGQSDLPRLFADLPGPWRKLEVLVAGDRLVASIDGHVVAAANRDDLRSQFASVQSEINKRHPDGGARLKGVPTRAPLGIWVSGAQVGIQNVVVTPIP